MNPIYFQGVNAVLGEHQPEYMDLPAAVVESENGMASVRTMWRPTKEEREAIQMGQCIELTLWTSLPYPPTLISVVEAAPLLRSATEDGPVVGLDDVRPVEGLPPAPTVAQYGCKHLAEMERQALEGDDAGFRVALVQHLADAHKVRGIQLHALQNLTQHVTRVFDKFIKLLGGR